VLVADDADWPATKRGQADEPWVSLANVMNRRASPFVLAGLLMAAAGASAQTTAPVVASVASPDWTRGWSGQFTLYAWIPLVQGEQEAPNGAPVIDVSASDFLSALDVAFMGNAQFRKDKFGLFFDAVYADLSKDGAAAQNLVTVELGTKLSVFTAAATYRIYEGDRNSVDLLGGVRHFDTSVSFSLRAAELGRDASLSQSWTNAIVGIRGSMQLSDRWLISGIVDVGGFDAGSDLTWEFYSGANYSFSDQWVATIGGRYMSITHAGSDGAILDVNFFGPLVGITYKF
jgi:hypothetical protein